MPGIKEGSASWFASTTNFTTTAKPLTYNYYQCSQGQQRSRKTPELLSPSHSHHLCSLLFLPPGQTKLKKNFCEPTRSCTKNNRCRKRHTGCAEDERGWFGISFGGTLHKLAVGQKIPNLLEEREHLSTDLVATFRS